MLNRMVGVEGTDMMRLLLSVGVSAFPMHLITVRWVSGNAYQFLFAHCIPLKTLSMQSLWSSRTACLFFWRWWSLLCHSLPVSIGDVRTVFSCPVCLKNRTASILCPFALAQEGIWGMCSPEDLRCYQLWACCCFLLMAHCEHGQIPFGIWSESLVSS